MSNILVYDVAAESGGAVSVLEHYYEIHKKDKKNHYYYLLGIHKLQDCDNISVINCPNVKKSWIHRIIFDYFEASKIIKRNNIDKVLSLQNTAIPGFKGPQTIYMHNILPFTEYRFSLLEDRKMWVYQNLIGRVIIHSLIKADRIIVQAEWIKNAIENKIPNCKGKIDVQFPNIMIPDGYKFELDHCSCFFYPANGSKFKNHAVIVNAVRRLVDLGIHDFTVALTLDGTENQYISRLKETCVHEHLPITWMGPITREKVFDMYSKSILIYPSYIETIGLPLYEARSVGTPIIASDCVFAHDVLQDYDNCTYFNWKSSKELVGIMAKILEQNK